jgi:hypothetical protein
MQGWSGARLMRGVAYRTVHGGSNGEAGRPAPPWACTETVGGNDSLQACVARPWSGERAARATGTTGSSRPHPLRTCGNRHRQ